MNRIKALEILKIKEPLPDKKDIKSLFRKVVKIVHPDVSGLDEKEANEKTIEVYQAYEFLMQNPLAIEQEIHEGFGTGDKINKDFWTNSYYDYRARDDRFFVDQETDRYDVLIINSKGMHAVLYHEKFGTGIKFYIPKPEFQPKTNKTKWDLENLCELFYSIIKEQGYSKEKTPYGWKVEDWQKQWGGWIFKKSGIKSDSGTIGDYMLELGRANFTIFSPMEWRDENLERIIPNRDVILGDGHYSMSLSGSDHFEFEPHHWENFVSNKEELKQTLTSYWTVLEKVLGDVSLMLVDPYFTWLPSINQIKQIYGEPKKVINPYGDYGNSLFSFSMNFGNQTEFVIAQNKYNDYKRGRRFHSPINVLDARNILENELLHLRMKKNSIVQSREK